MFVIVRAFYPVPLAFEEGFGLLEHLIVYLLLRRSRGIICCVRMHLISVKIYSSIVV